MIIFLLSFACAFAPAGRVSSSSLKMAFAKGLPGADGPELKNFDPLKFSESENLMYFREAELKHGRIAMLATAGIFIIIIIIIIIIIHITIIINFIYNY